MTSRSGAHQPSFAPKQEQADVAARPLAGLAPAFFAEACALIEAPWALSAVPDFVFPETQGQRPPDLDRMLKFGRALNRLAASDPAVHKKMLEVQHLLKPRSVLRDPDLVQRVQAGMAEA